MKTDTIARIVLQPDGSTHIALRNCQTYGCTAFALKSLLADPHVFESQGCLALNNTSRFVNPKRFSCDNIPGVTLATLSTEKCLIFEFVDLFLLAYEKINTPEEHVILNLNTVIDSHALTDRKQYLLDYYLKTVNAINEHPPLTQKIFLSDETQTNILREIINACYEKESSGLSDIINRAEEKASVSPETILDAPTYIQDNGVPSNFIALDAFAKRYEVTTGTVRNWIKKNKLPSAVKDESGRWHINPEDKPKDRRADRRTKTDPATKRKYITLKGTSYKDVQEYIKNRKLVTDAVRPFIRTVEEIQYYERNGYHEVCWDGKAAMIIDIRPYYYSKLHGKTNQELIKEGRSPVIPSDEAHCYHLHHIGQKVDSPLAIIPETIHNSREFNSVFHLSKDNNDNLHSSVFEMEKRSFWAKYLEVYSQYKEFSRIPYENSKHTKYKR